MICYYFIYLLNIKPGFPNSQFRQRLTFTIIKNNSHESKCLIKNH